LLFVGRAFALKGGPDALAVFERVKRAVPDAHLVVAGPDRPAYVPSGVDWLGPVSRDQLYDEVYPRADMFLYPTHFDCAPFVVQEALAHGLPVLAPRIMALPEFVRDGQTGHLFDPGDLDDVAALAIALLRDRATLQRMKTAALADFDARFSIGHRNDVLGALYESLVP
jgi:glycosyltransferase involved in cell wall biosynthesis